MATQDRIRVKSKTKKALDTLVDKLKARRKGKVTYDDAITHLFDKHSEVGRLERKVHKLETENTTLNVKLEAGVPPTVEGPVVPENPEGGEPSTTPAQAPMITERPPLASASSQCDFYSLVDGIVHCSKDFDRKGIVHRVTEDVCDKCWDRIQGRLQEDNLLAKNLPCLRRFQDVFGKYHCVRHPPKATPLALGLKTCKACEDRLTEEIVATKGITLVTRRYVTCGATEQIDKERGVMLYSRNSKCPHKNTWITIEQCQEANCPLLKTMKVPITD